MNKSYAMSLIITCLSFSLYSMEITVISADQSSFKATNIQTLYNKTYDKITQITPTSTTAETVLCEILNNIKELKQSNVTENQIGKFAFNQPSSVKNKLFNLTNAPYNGPAYISVFFERLRQYNELLTKNNFTSPTKEELSFHKENTKILTALNNASKYGVFFTPELTENRKIFTTIPNTIAIEEFKTLIQNIYTMRCTPPDEIITMANILYDTNNSSQ